MRYAKREQGPICSAIFYVALHGWCQLIGILLINFGILRVQGTSLTQQASASQAASGETERDVGHISPEALENFIASFFALVATLLPINTRGFYDKSDILELLETNQLGKNQKASDAFAAQDVPGALAAHCF